MSFNGDLDDSAAGDASSDVVFATGRAIKTKTTMTLASTSGMIVAKGTLSLIAGSGIVVWEDMKGESGGAKLIINTDYERPPMLEASQPQSSSGP